MQTIGILPILVVGLENLENGTNSYICDSIQEQLEDDMITEQEFEEVVMWLDDNKPTPTKHKKFFNHPHYIQDKEGEPQEIGWWRSSVNYKNDDVSVECHNQRKLFVKHLINLIKVEHDIPLD